MCNLNLKVYIKQQIIGVLISPIASYYTILSIKSSSHILKGYHHHKTKGQISQFQLYNHIILAKIIAFYYCSPRYSPHFPLAYYLSINCGWIHVRAALLFLCIRPHFTYLIHQLVLEWGAFHFTSHN